MISLSAALLLVASGDPGPAVDPAAVRAAVARSVPFLQKEGTAWLENKGCVSCHHVPVAVWSLQEAAGRGFAVDRDVLATLRAEAIDAYGEPVAPEELPNGQDKNFAGSGPASGNVYVAIALRGSSPDEATVTARIAFAGHVLSRQTDAGCWTVKTSTAPLVDGDDVLTAQVLLALGRDEASEAARRKAAAWLEANPPRDEAQPVALGLLAVVEAVPWLDQAELVKRLRALQREDGGWAQLLGRESDAVVTGEAVAALTAAGVTSDDPAVANGVAFLLRTQREDGSWLVKSRNPKGHDDIVSYYGTGWATVALARLLPAEPGKE